MSHRHFCDAAGHDWYCEGRALRLGANEPSDCICVVHQTAMEEGDHTSCPIELLACPEHRDEQQRKMKDAVSKCGDGEMDAAPEDWTDKDSGPIFGFCLWCNRDFFTMDEVWAHNADNSAACLPFQEFIKEQSTSPSMPTDAEPLDDGEPQ